MYHKHPLIPSIKTGSDLVLHPSDEAEICMSCKLEDKKCSYSCKRYKEELDKLKQGGRNGDSNGNKARKG